MPKIGALVDAAAGGSRPLRRLPTCGTASNGGGGEGVCLRGWEGSLPLTWAGSPSRARERCTRLAARTWRRGKVELEEVEEAGEEVEEGLLDEVEGGACRGPTVVAF